MYICMCGCMYVCMSVWMYVSVYVCECEYICVCGCMHVCIYICVYMWCVYLYVCMYVCICGMYIFVFGCQCVCICLYVDTYVCVCTWVRDGTINHGSWFTVWCTIVGWRTAVSSFIFKNGASLSLGKGYTCRTGQRKRYPDSISCNERLSHLFKRLSLGCVTSLKS